MDTMVYEDININELISDPDFKALAHDFHDEVKLFKGSDLSIDYNMLEEGEDRNKIHTFGVYECGRFYGNKLAGFALFNVYRYLFGDEYIAACLCIYLAPEHRRGLNGIKLLEHCESSLKDKADLIEYGCPVSKDWSILLKRRSFKEYERHWYKRL